MTQNARFLKVAVEAAESASKILVHYFSQSHALEISEKSPANLVTVADQEAEAAVRDILFREFPDHQFIGEESSEARGVEKTDAHYKWIVDPLDGTTNFIHGFPVFGVSIGLEYKGELILGVVQAPILGKNYEGLLNEGAKVNGRTMRVSRRHPLGQSLVATGFASQSQVGIVDQIAMLSAVLHKTRGVRRAGAAALDLCFVAEGIFDGFWESQLKPWDTAAGALLVREAGGKVVNQFGDTYSPFNDFCIATNGLIDAELRELITSVNAASRRD